jgi:hypothetical protein
MIPVDTVTDPQRTIKGRIRIRASYQDETDGRNCWTMQLRRRRPIRLME